MQHDSFREWMSSTALLGSKLGLETMHHLCERLGHPQNQLRFVHVAGTNGKGSTSAMITSMLQASGYKTGLYLSPYVLDYCECMQINGEMISREALCAVAEAVHEAALCMKQHESPTEYEVLTAIAFLWFLREGCDVVVLETGLGGRLDATNVIPAPLVSVITSISYDHIAVLGDTLEKIAREKCGIIKRGGVTVCDPLQPESVLQVIQDCALEKENTFVVPKWDDAVLNASGLDGTAFSYGVKQLFTPMIGTHQIRNALMAVETMEVLRDCYGFSITNDNIRQGMSTAILPVRQEIVCRHPLVLLDGAHNRAGLACLSDTVSRYLQGRRIIVIMGMLADKEYQLSVATMSVLCNRFIAVEPISPRALSSSILAKEASLFCSSVMQCCDYATAMQEAMNWAGPLDAIVICGSLYLAMPMRELIQNTLQQDGRYGKGMLYP